jgi:hypothetical protein
LQAKLGSGWIGSSQSNRVGSDLTNSVCRPREIPTGRGISRPTNRFGSDLIQTGADPDRGSLVSWSDPMAISGPDRQHTTQQIESFVFPMKKLVPRSGQDPNANGTRSKPGRVQGGSHGILRLFPVPAFLVRPFPACGSERAANRFPLKLKGILVANVPREPPCVGPHEKTVGIKLQNNHFSMCRNPTLRSRGFQGKKKIFPKPRTTVGDQKDCMCFRSPPPTQNHRNCRTRVIKSPIFSRGELNCKIIALACFS